MISDLWLESLHEAYYLHRGERLNELHGVRVKRFDERGLHPESVVWGGILKLEALCPDLAGAGADPVLMRSEAHRDAEAMFKAEILAAA